jgi:hypothetical protein
MSDVDELDPTSEGESEHFGSVYFGPLPAAAGDRIRVLSNPLIRGLPGPVAVHLFRTDPQVSVGLGSNAAVRALISYANGAATNQFRCDWDGQFSIVCNKITIELEGFEPRVPDGNTIGEYDPDETKKAKWGALIGIGAIPSGGRDAVGYTLPGIEIAPAATSQVAVPDFGRRWFPHLVKFNGVTGEMVGLTDAELSLVQVTFVDLSASGFVDRFPLSRDLMRDGITLLGAAPILEVLNDTSATLIYVPHFKLGL